MAEILITLSIIGVVAALTIPSLLLVNDKKERSVRLKKFYSTMQNALMLSNLDGVSLDRANGYDGMMDFANMYLSPYLSYTKMCKVGPECSITWGDQWWGGFIYILSDGTMFGCTPGGAGYDCMADINGKKAPNRRGIDIFDFMMIDKAGEPPTVSFIPYNWRANLTNRETALQSCKNSSSTCACLLLYFDNWEFKDDYPY